MSKSGKKTKRPKGKSLQEFMSEGKPINSSQVTKTVVTSWADAVEEEECRPPQTFSLPTAPRASRVFDYVPENSPFTAYLSKLPYDANREDIEEFFSEMNITDIKLPREDDNSTKNRGFAYVEFAKREDLIAAISMPDPTLMNRRFKIDLPNEEQGKGRSGGGRGRYDNFGSNVDENSTNWRKDIREDNDGGGLGGRRGGSGYGYNNRDRDRQQRDPSPETGNWRDKQRPRSDSPPPDRFQKGRGGYNQDRDRDSNNDFRRDGGRDGDRDRDRGGDRYPRRNNPNNGYEERNNRETATAAAGEEQPRERPKLNLAPRTLPMPELKVDEEEVKKEEEEVPVVEEEVVVEPPRPKPTPVPAATIFGSAKPVDTAAKEREIEERMEKQRVLEEERERERNEKAAVEESSEKEPEVVVNDNQVNSWRRRDNERDADDLPRTQSPPRNRRYSPDRRGRGKFDDRRGGRDRDYDNYNRRDNRDRDNRDNRDNNRDHRNRDQRDQRGDRNRGDNYNRGGGGGGGNGGVNRNEITRSRDDKDKPTRRDKSADDHKDIDRMPKYQAPVKPKLQMSNKYEDLLDEDGSD